MPNKKKKPKTKPKPKQPTVSWKDTVLKQLIHKEHGSIIWEPLSGAELRYQKLAEDSISKLHQQLYDAGTQKRALDRLITENNKFTAREDKCKEWLRQLFGIVKADVPFEVGHSNKYALSSEVLFKVVERELEITMATLRAVQEKLARLQ